MALMTFERDYDEARNEYFGLTDDPAKIRKEIDPDRGHLSAQEIADIMEVACDKICQYPAEFKDPYDMSRKICASCPLGEKLWEFGDE